MNAENIEITDGSQAAATEVFDDNVLVISEEKNKVILPYSIEEFKKALCDGHEQTELRELIDKKYTVPLSRYKHGCISRFREAYALVRERGNGSVWAALNLATEMFFTSLLHPAVITACKSPDWLDVYLDCLNSNELDEFPFFRIRYETKASEKKRRSKE